MLVFRYLKMKYDDVYLSLMHVVSIFSCGYTYTKMKGAVLIDSVQ